MFSLSKKKRLIGLDIGSNSIKMAEVFPSGKRFQLVRIGYVPLPLGDLSPEIISPYVKTMLNDINVKNRDATVGIGGSALIIKKISIPRTTGRDIEEQIKWEAEQYIPFSPSQVSLTFEVLQNASSEGTMDVLLVAAQKNALKSHWEIVKNANINCSIIDANSFAVANCFNFNYPDDGGKNLVLVNIGANITNLVVIQMGEVIFCRDLAIGGNMYTNGLHKQLGISLEEAEALKIEVSLQQDHPQEVLKVLNEVTDSFVAEIKNTLDFFTSLNPDVKIEEGFYCGGGSLLPDLIQKISKNTDLNLNAMSPFTSLKISSEQLSEDDRIRMAPFMSNVIGLALRSMGDH